jgi:diguanylate cyclase (GGDEF)-like protein
MQSAMTNVRILVVDDDETLGSIVAQVLEEEGHEVTVVQSGEEALALFAQQAFPLVFTDLVMGEVSGLHLLEEIKKTTPDIQVIVMTGHASMDTAVQAMRAGAHDYLVKPFEDLDLITAVARRTIEKIELITQNRLLIDSLAINNRELTELNVRLAEELCQRQRAEKEIHELAYFDPLTGLPNRTLFRDRLDYALAQAWRTKNQLAVLILDLDRFKHVIESLGHEGGDHVLKVVAARLQENIRQSDTLAHLGGDEFALLIPVSKDEQEPARVAEKILALLSHPLKVEGKEFVISASIGIALHPADGNDRETLLKHADMALFGAKDKGRNGYLFFSEKLNRKNRDRRFLCSSLARALQQNELFLAFQPQIDLRNGQITACEALLRWRHPNGQLIEPSQFIPIAEETGLIRPIGEWVLRNACTLNRAWQLQGHTPYRIAVNISAHQYNQDDFLDYIDRILDETAMDPHFLELELTEGLLMENVERTINTLTHLKDRGIHLAIDDFGTGYSSLNYLRHFPVDLIKIDRSFVQDLGTGRGNSPIIDAIIAMAHGLGLRVLAEGVETPAQLSYLQERHCHEMQGYYFGRPMPNEEFCSLLPKN